MKGIKLTTILLLVISLVLQFVSIPVSAEILSSGSQNSGPTAIISSTLKEHLLTAGKNELIPVTIELKDDIDLDAVEQKAIKHADLSTEEKALLSADTSRLSEEENQAHQLEALTIRDKIYSERHKILEEYYENKNGTFIADNGLSDVKIGSIGIYTPFIRDALLTREQIKALEANKEVCYMDYAGNDEDIVRGPVLPSIDVPSIDDTYQIINGDVCVNSGYTGSGIRVGLVEEGHPITSVMGNNINNITKDGGATNSESVHATMTSGIIIKFAPGC